MRYLLVHFVNERDRAGKLYFSISKDGVYWKELNHEKAVISFYSPGYHLRNPLPVRDPRTGGLYILALEEVVEAGSQREKGVSEREENYRQEQENNGQMLVVWKSDDLVNWNQDAVFIQIPELNHPEDLEAFYVEERQEFLITWAIRCGEEAAQVSYDIYGSYTKQFERFDQPFFIDHMIATVDAQREYLSKRYSNVVPITEREYEILTFFYNSADD